MQIKEMSRRLGQPGGGVTFLGVAAILYGLACFLQGDFAIYWQPVPEGVPLRQPLAYLSAGLLILGIWIVIPIREFQGIFAKIRHKDQQPSEHRADDEGHAAP